jgi:hypothetical protein
MKGLIWKLRAYRYMRSRIGWARWEMVASLYESFPGWSPEEAINEDLSYWN